MNKNEYIPFLSEIKEIKKHTDIFIRWVPNRHFRTKFGIVDARDTILDISQQTLELKTSIIAG